MKLDALKALKITRNNRDKKFPDREDSRYQDRMLFPALKPKFQVGTPSKVFTIGSCFARNIERALQDYDVELPTQEFSVPESEWPHLPNGLLNEYNAGTISQRVLSALGLQESSEETIIEEGDGFVDLLLPRNTPVTFERIVARRAEIDDIYENMVSSDLVVITLGLVEAWFDEESGVYLNRMPSRSLMRSQPERYTFRRLDVFDSSALLDRAMKELIGAGVEKILLTVSPVPLGTTFSGDDAIVANSYSKAVLRVSAEKLAKEYPQVDYFPSYEMVSSGGLDVFNPDNTHVRLPVVRRITGHMLEAYFPELEAKPAAGSPASASAAQSG